MQKMQKNELQLLINRELLKSLSVIVEGLTPVFKIECLRLMISDRDLKSK